MDTKKIQLKRTLKKLNISVIGNYVKKSEVKKALALAADIENAYKTNENNEWTVFKLPCDDSSTKGVSTFDAFHYFCSGTRWVTTNEFWEQLKDAGKTIFIFVSKTKDKANPLWKVATDELEHTYLDAHDNQVTDISNLQLPSVNYTPPAATEKCTCDIYELMRNGCKCGGYEKEKSQKSLTSELHKLGIKTYRKKSTNKVFVKRKDVRSAFAAHMTKANVYYVTVDGHDFAYNNSLDVAKSSALNALKEYPKASIAIQVYSGRKHGSGGHLIKTLALDSKTKKFVTAAGKWEPDAEDLYDYANNVESLYNELLKLHHRPHAIKEVAEMIIEEYNDACKDNCIKDLRRI